MQKSSGDQRSEDSYKLLCGNCPDGQCRARLFFPAYDKSIECTSCGQRHEKSSIQNVAEVTSPSIALHNILKSILLGSVKPKKGADNVKVLGLSNYVCKLISPILTEYGMDKKTGKAKLLTELSQPAIFDCGKILGSRAFLIEEENLDVNGYGRDRTGSIRYLSDTLNVIKDINEGQERLVPIHADGDGHCLVHAVSRALVGRELFWHALRWNLLTHFKTNLDKYKELFKEFIDVNEWDVIIQECDPDYRPCDGEPLGLRNIHVFGLANVLKRPIILLDSVSGMQSLGDYSGVFLPGMVPPSECCSSDGTANKPLCIAWSSSGRNHYIPLVGVKGRPQPLLPRYMIQKAWGMPAILIDKYIQFDDQGHCVIGGDKCLSDRYIRQLVSAMEEVYLEKYGVQPKLVADVHQYLYKSSGIVGVPMDQIRKTTQQSVQRKTLYRCLTCEALIEYQVPQEWFRKGGSLYNMAIQIHGPLRADKKYSFQQQGVVCGYDKENDVLVPDMAKCKLSVCSFCQGDNFRLINGDGSIQYENGDRTSTPSTSSNCTCGFKHYWNGKEYDNIPELFPIRLEWNGQVVEEKFEWFQHESNTSLNSNVYEVAQSLVNKHFPGEFGSERLVQRVVDTILRQTAPKGKDKEEAMVTSSSSNNSAISPYQDDAWSSESPSKIILTGHKKKTIHKEELTMSQKEKQVKQQIETQAAKQQQRKTKELLSTSSPKSSPKKSKSLAESRETTPSPVAMEMTPKVPANQKQVRVATSDGRQVKLTITSEVNYVELQKLISEALDVPPEKQRIRIGFPPKELKPPPTEEEDSPIPLTHGDKILLEVAREFPLAVASGDTQRQSHYQFPGPGRGPTMAPSSTKPSWSGFEEDANAPSFENILHSFKDTHQGNDSLDAAIASLAIMSTIKGRDFWTHLQTMPHLFSVGGLFYKQVERDLGLVDGKHCQLPVLPGKVFRFNKQEDRLEICLEPYGHFPIEPDVEKRVKESGFVGTSGTTDGSFSAFSGAVGRDKHKHAVFSGQGHSLKVEPDIERMPQDIPENMSRHARHLHTFCDPNVHQDSIAEEHDQDVHMSENQDKDNACSKIEPAASNKTYKRLGPGYSVVNPEVVNTTNENLQLFRDLADTIERTMSEEIAQIDEEIEKLDEEERKKSCSSLKQVSETSEELMETGTDAVFCDSSNVKVESDSPEQNEGTTVSGATNVCSVLSLDEENTGINEDSPGGDNYTPTEDDSINASGENKIEIKGNEKILTVENKIAVTDGRNIVSESIVDITDEDSCSAKGEQGPASMEVTSADSEMKSSKEIDFSNKQTSDLDTSIE